MKRGLSTGFRQPGALFFGNVLNGVDNIYKSVVYKNITVLE